MFHPNTPNCIRKTQTLSNSTPSPLGRCDASQKAGIAYMDVAIRRPGKGREQERKLEGDSNVSTLTPALSQRERE
jgi:hypothetical protein